MNAKKIFLFKTLAISSTLVISAVAAQVSEPPEKIELTDDYAGKFEQVQPTKCDEHYLKRIAYFKKSNSTVKPGGLVLLGDSISEVFPINGAPKEWNLISRGISGDGIGGGKHRGLSNRLRVSCHDLKPSAVFIKIGINDIVDWGMGIKQTDEAERLKNYRRVIQDIKKFNPKANVFISSVLPARTINNPRGKKRDFGQYNATIVPFNAQLKIIAKEEKITFVDLHQSFVEKGGDKIRADLTSDGVHLSRAGYALWIKELKKLKLFSNAEQK